VLFAIAVTVGGHGVMQIANQIRPLVLELPMLCKYQLSHWLINTTMPVH